MERRIAFVTGATGFLGAALSQRLIAEGWEVVAFGRRAPATALGDLREIESLRRALPVGATVFHGAAKVGSWGPRREYEEANVGGTQNLLRVAAERETRRFVHVSTPSVCFRWANRLDVRESDPLPERAANAYAWSKRLAEEAVRASALPSVIVRPRAIFGAEDTYIVRRIVEALHARKLPRVGDGANCTDLTFLDNVLDALLLLAEAPVEACVGRTFHVTNGEPIRLWKKLAGLCERLRIPPPARHLPFGIAFALATVLELIGRAIGQKSEPRFTRYTACLLGRSQTLNIDAIRALGYAPRVSVDEGLDRFARWWEARR